MNLTKLVDFIARIPAHLDIHFYDFSMNFYTFLKFAVLSSSTFCIFNPGTLVSFNLRSLGGLKQRRAVKGASVPGEESRRR